MHREFNINIVQLHDAVHVEIDGEFDMATAPLLSGTLIEAEVSDARLIVVDLSGVTFIDSTGLRVLLEGCSRSEQDGNRLRITGGSEQARKLFRLAGVLDRLPFISTTEALRDDSNVAHQRRQREEGRVIDR